MKNLLRLLSLALVLTMLVSVPASAEEPYEFTVMANFFGSLKEDQQAYLADLEQKLNIKIKPIAPASSAYTEALQMMLAGQEYADLVLYLNVNDKVFLDAVKSGLYLPLNEYLKDCPNLTAYSYDISWDTLKVLGDENIYAVPRTSIARADGYAFRQDWMENLGIDYVDSDYLTVDELYDILYAFTYKDPDGNGKDDTYGLAMATNGGTMAPEFRYAFGLTGWQEYDGQYMDLMYSREHDNFKRCLEFTHKLWEDGLIDPDWPTIDNVVMDDRFYAGMTGFHFYFPGNMAAALEKGAQVNPEFALYFTPGVVETEGQVFAGGAFSTGFWGAWAVSSTAKEPERIMQMLDYLLSDEGWPEAKYGLKDLCWTENDGVVEATEQYNSSPIGGYFLRRNNDAGFFVSLALDPVERAKTERRIQLCIDQCKFPLDGGYRAPVKDDPTFIDYEKYMSIEIAKIITGERPVDDWDELLNGWYEAGGDQYIEEMRAFISASQGK